MINDDLSKKKSPHFREKYLVLSYLKARDFVLMQSAIAEKHTWEQGAHQPYTQSLEKVNLDNSKSNNNQSNNIQPLKLDKLRNSTWIQATTRNIVLQKSWKKLKNQF